MEWKKQAYTCAEMQNPELRPPKKLADVFEDTSVQFLENHEVFLCILHVLVTEENFIPCTTSKLWHKTHFYSISYTHPTTGDIECQLKYLPLGKSAIVFAVAGTKEVAKEHMNYELYIKDKSSKDPTKVYKDISKLSILFKDNIVKNMLVGAQECANIDPTFGLPILATEMKLEILYHMDVTGLLALSSASQEFNQLIDSAIWQHALFRDFPKHREETEGDWKALYKIEYLAKKKAEKQEKERLKKLKEEQEREMKYRRTTDRRGMDFFEDRRRHPAFSDFFGLPERNLGLPQRRFGLPERGFGLPERGFGLPERGFGLPERGFGLPDRGFGLPERRSGLPERHSGLPEGHFGFPKESFKRADMPRINLRW